MTGVSDLSRFLQLQTQTSRMQTDLHRYTHELSSGEKADLAQAVRGDFLPLSTVTRGVSIAESYLGAADTAAMHYANSQTILEAIQSDIDDLGAQLLSVSTMGQTSSIMSALGPAETVFNNAVQGLNTQIGGRSLFAGAATDGPALISAADMYAQLETALIGVPDAAGMIQIVDDWFDMAGGPFETTAFLGDAAQSVHFNIAEGERVSSDFSALDPSVRSLLKGLALATLTREGVGPQDAASIAELGQAAASRVLTAQDQMHEARAEIGILEARIDVVKTRHSATLTSLSINYQDIVSADPFETATRLQETEARLESIYLTTARLSRLSLAEYLR